MTAKPGEAPTTSARSTLCFQRPSYHPLASVAAAFIVGIVLARFHPLEVSPTLALGASCVVISLFRRNPYWRQSWLLLAITCLGMVRWQMYFLPGGDRLIDDVAQPESQLVRLRGVVCSAPEFHRQSNQPHHSAYPQADKTRLILECEEIVESGRYTPIEGRVYVQVTELARHIEIGDRIELTGWLMRPLSAANPGGFDFAEWLKLQRIQAMLFVGHPEAVSVLSPAVKFRAYRMIVQLRRQLDHRIAQSLPATQAAVTSALLIGQRSQLPDETRDAFIRSGMMHLLAISGLHVAIFTGFLWMFCRVLQFSPRTTAVIVTSCCWLLCLISGMRPPVLRASLFLTLAMLGWVLERPRHAENILAASILLLLFFNPTQVFDTGAQLSCLAVIGILWSERWPRHSVRRLKPTEKMMTPRGVLIKTAILNALLPMLKFVLGIWLLTTPIISHAYGLISPIGFLLNILLTPFLAPLLALGYLFLGAISLLPSIAFPLTFLYGQLLQAILTIIEWIGRQDWSAVTVLPPSFWVIVIYYLLLCTSIFCTAWRKRILITAVLLLTWNLFVPPPSLHQSEFKCTFLSVGHGCAILIRMPSGKTLLYDAGAIDNAERATRAVQAILRDWRVGRIDTVLISHADLDHLNGVFGLIDRGLVRALSLSASSLESKQPAMQDLIATAGAHDVAVNLLSRNDRLQLDPDVNIRLRNPPADRAWDTDNENSLVLEIRYQGRRLLLTGDIEGAALDALTAQAEPVDVLLAPHHGSPRIIHSAVDRAFRPIAVVVSTGTPHVGDRLGQDYRCPVLSTRECGAVSVTITREGHISVRTSRAQRPTLRPVASQ